MSPSPSTAAAAQQARPAAKSAKTVVVGSRLPFTLELQLCKPMKTQVQGRFGPSEETIHVKHGSKVFIHGNTLPQGGIPKGYKTPPQIVGNAALTPGVDAEFFAEWMRQHKDTEFVQNGLVFAHAGVEGAEGIALDDRAVASGLDPINPDGDDRLPRPIDTSISVIARAERTAA